MPPNAVGSLLTEDGEPCSLEWLGGRDMKDTCYAETGR